MSEEKEVVIPQTIGGMLKSGRYAWLRKKGIKTDEIAALVLMHERGPYPGERLFTGKNKRTILDPKYKKLRKQTEKEIGSKYREMRKGMEASLLKAKEKLAKEGVDWDKVTEEDKKKNEATRNAWSAQQDRNTGKTE